MTLPERYYVHGNTFAPEARIISSVLNVTGLNNNCQKVYCAANTFNREIGIFFLSGSQCNWP